MQASGLLSISGRVYSRRPPKLGPSGAGVVHRSVGPSTVPTSCQPRRFPASDPLTVVATRVYKWPYKSNWWQLPSASGARCWGQVPLRRPPHATTGRALRPSSAGRT